MNRLMMMILCAALAVLTSPVWAEPELDGARGTDFLDREFRGQVGMAGQPSSSEAGFRSFGGSSAYSCANHSAGGDRQVRYPFTLPQDRYLEWVRVWGRKTEGTTDVTLRLRKSCMSQSQTVPSTVTLTSQTVTGAPGEFSRTLSAFETVDNLNCKYWVDVDFGPNTEACSAITEQLAIYKIRTQSLLPDQIFWDGFRVGTN